MSLIGTIRDATTGLSVAVQAPTQTPTGNAMLVQIGPGDVISNIPVILDFDHHQIHEGETHKAIDQQLSLGTGTVKYGITVATYAITVRSPHMIISCFVYNGNVRIDFYHTATFTGGSLLTVNNRNRNSATTPGSTITGGVTSTNGTLLDSYFVGAGSKGSGDTRAASEWLLKSNSIYRVDLVGLVANTQAIMHFDWYEDLGT